MDQPLTTVLAAADQAASHATDRTSPFGRAGATLRSFGAARLLVLGATALGMPGLFAFLLLRVAEPHFTLLYGELELEDSAAIVGRLEALGVTFRLQGDGRAILVPADQALRLRMTLAEEGLPRGGTVGDEMFDQQSALGTTDFLANVNLRRALEGELARTIASLADVRAARVHLVLPRRELFRRDQIEPSASVTLHMYGGRRLDHRQVQSVQHLVAAAVPELSPARITLVDQQGTLPCCAPPAAAGSGSRSRAVLRQHVRARGQDPARRHGGHGAGPAARRGGSADGARDHGQGAGGAGRGVHRRRQRRRRDLRVMAARCQFDPWFKQGEGMAAALPGGGPEHDAVTQRFDFPWLEAPHEPEGAEAGCAPPPKTFSEAELEAALAAAGAEAAGAAEASVRAELEAGMTTRRTSALELIAAALGAHRLALDQAIAGRASASRDLALALARALVRRALERQPLADVEAMLRDLVVRLEDQPRPTLALPPALVEAGQRLAREISAQTAYRGELVVEPDGRLGAGDARLSWPGGAAERDLALLEREAIAVVDAWLPESPADSRATECQAASTSGAMP